MKIASSARMAALMLCTSLSACIGLPNINNMFYPVESNKPDYTRGGSERVRAESRKPLQVPPKLQGEVSVPMPDKVATEAAVVAKGGSKGKKSKIRGRTIALDTREYSQRPDQVFSTVIDAMTALNMPVESVDSPSGTITTTWVRHDANNPNSYTGAAMNIFGAGPTHTRYRFIVRVLRTKSGGTLLEIRTLGQQYINRHWVNKPIKRKVANELFAAIEERLPPLPGSNTAGARLPVAKPLKP